MRAGETTGCCAASNFYNVGGAHGHKTADSQEQFELWMVGLKENSINYSLTNEDQDQTREYMKVAGWDVYGPYDGLYISVISGENIQKIKQNVTRRERLFKEDIRKKAEEDQRQRKERESRLKFSHTLNPNIYQGQVTEEEILRLCGTEPYMIIRGDNRRTNIRLAIQEKYKITLPNGWWDQTAQELRQMVYDLVYKARKTAGIL